MKKTISLLSMFFFAAFSIAQGGWKSKVHHADELKGTEEWNHTFYT